MADEPAVPELVVSGRFIDLQPVIATQDRLPAAALARTRPRSLADALRLAPGAHIQTNSRGQTLVFLRNSGERQTALFYDGAPLTVPWDNRLDASLIPAAALADVAVTKGPASVRFGPNTVGGIIELVPAAPEDDMPRTQVTGEAGALGLQAGEAGVLAPLGAWDLTLGAGVRERAALPLPEGAAVPFSQADPNRRTNTDSRRVNGLVRAARPVPGGEIAASAFVADSRFGIAPESHVDPALGRVRFWRYPDSRLAMGILSADVAVSERTDLKATGWVQRFDQTIDSYASAAYRTIEDRQVDDDLALGLRTAVDHRIGRHTLRASAIVSVATHKQRDIAFAGGAPPSDRPARDIFRQRTVSLGAEYRFRADARTTLFLGAGGDWMDPTRTGGRPDSGDFLDYNLIGGVRWQAGGGWTLRASAGRKVRLPTMRELFGAAIGRFVINPDLTAERTVLAELGARWQRDWLTVSVVPFANLVSDTLDQRNVAIGGETKRQRVNLAGSRVYGVETSLRAEPAPHWQVSGHLTAMRVRRKQDAPGDPLRIAEKPAVRARLDVAYRDPGGLGATVSVDHTGRAFSFTDAGTFRPLARSTVLDVEISYDLARAFRAVDRLRAFVRIDNVADTLVEPQLGLPGPGRLIRGGVDMRF